MTLEEIVNNIIAQTLKRNGGNVLKTASQLAISPNTIYRRGIDKTDVDHQQEIREEIQDVVEGYQTREIDKLLTEHRQLKALAESLLSPEELEEIKAKWELRKKGNSQQAKALAATV